MIGVTCDFGEGVTAVLVCNKGADVTEAGAEGADGRLAKFKMPKRVFVVDELHATPWARCRRIFCRIPTGFKLFDPCERGDHTP